MKLTMMMLVLLAAAVPAWAQVAKTEAAAAPDPLQRALGQMVAEAQQRELVALMRAITAEQRVAALEAEAKAKTPPETAAPAEPPKP